MIKVDLWGRMGNQMFQYVFAVNTSKKFKTFFLIMPKEKFELIKYFKLDFLTRLCYNKFIFRFYRFIVARVFLFQYIFQNNEGSIELNNNKCYRGFFQSEDYFVNSKEVIQNKFKIKKEWEKKYIEKYYSIFNESDKIIVMHIRRTDYVNFGDDHVGGKNLTLPMSYYDNCLNLINNLEEYKIVCISDDINFVKNYFKERVNYFFLKNEAIIDFQIILNAEIAIIANSSFSWWAAYLNNKKNKIIYAPKYWFGFKVNTEIPENIIPENFLTVDTN